MNIVKIVTIKKIESSPRYDLEVENVHNFFANSVLVHNCRMIATKEGLFTRKGEKYYMDSVPHIWEDLQKFFEVYPDAVLDGEVFNDGLKDRLNELNSICATKKGKKINEAFLQKSKEICQYHIYDGYGFAGLLETNGYDIRMGLLKDLIEDKNRGLVGQSIKSIDTWLCESEEEMLNVYNDYVAEGGEGVILRVSNMKYEHKRSKNLLKVKPEDDTEVYITDIQDGSGNWAGKAKVISVHDKDGNIKDGLRFDVTFKGNMTQAEKFLAEKDLHIGKKITIKYNGLTGLGTPQYAQLDYNNFLSHDKA